MVLGSLLSFLYVPLSFPVTWEQKNKQNTRPLQRSVGSECSGALVERV